MFQVPRLSRATLRMNKRAIFWWLNARYFDGWTRDILMVKRAIFWWLNARYFDSWTRDILMVERAIYGWLNAIYLGDWIEQMIIMVKNCFQAISCLFRSKSKGILGAVGLRSKQRPASVEGGEDLVISNTNAEGKFL